MALKNTRATLQSYINKALLNMAPAHNIASPLPASKSTSASQTLRPKNLQDESHKEPQGGNDRAHGRNNRTHGGNERTHGEGLSISQGMMYGFSGGAKQRTSDNLNSNHQRGLQCELKVADHFKASGYRWIHHRLKTPFAEVDLLFEGVDHFLMVEVKSCSSLQFAIGKLRGRQKQRLQRAYLHLTEVLPKPLRYCVVLVVHDEMHILEDVLG